MLKSHDLGPKKTAALDWLQNLASKQNGVAELVFTTKFYGCSDGIPGLQQLQPRCVSLSSSVRVALTSLIAISCDHAEMHTPRPSLNASHQNMAETCQRHRFLGSRHSRNRFGDSARKKFLLYYLISYGENKSINSQTISVGGSKYNDEMQSMRITAH